MTATASERRYASAHSHHASSQPPPSADQISAAPLSPEAAANFPHQCDPATLHRPLGQRRSASRLIGLDMARGIALIGMIAVHTIEAGTRTGDMSLAWTLAAGKSAALFALLGGVGIAFMTGRTAAPRGMDALRAAATPVVRGLIIALIGLTVGGLVAYADAAVVLAYLGVMFALAGLLVPLRTRSLLVLGFGWAIVSPFISHVVRQSLPQAEPVNLGLGALADPGSLLQTLVFTGAFPAFTWMAYICIGMALGRSALTSRLVIAKILAGGVLLTLVTSVASSILTDGFHLRQRLADDVASGMSLSRFTDYLVFGADGTLPTTSWWWLGLISPHTATPLDLLHTIGTSLIVLGGCLALAKVFGTRFLLLAVPGSMTLTLYTLHVLALQPLRGFSDNVHFLVQVVLLCPFAIVWGRYYQQGPMERMLSTLTRALTPRRTPAGVAGSSTASPVAPAANTGPSSIASSSEASSSTPPPASGRSDRNALAESGSEHARG